MKSKAKINSRKKWNETSIEALYQLPLFELIYQAYTIHRENFDPKAIELCSLLSIKTGGCSEDCAYCSQGKRAKKRLKKSSLIDIDEVVKRAKIAKRAGAKRFCMSASGRSPASEEFSEILGMVKQVKALGLETCLTLGILTKNEAMALKVAGLDVYNHNLDTSPQYYPKIITTHTYQDRLETLKNVVEAGIKICCGGIMGMGELREDRIQFLLTLTQLPHPPDKIPINRLVPISDTPLESTPPIDDFEFIKTVAITRILLPQSVIRLAAGRKMMSDEMQAWCLMAGANSIFYGEELLTTDNPTMCEDNQLLQKLGFKIKQSDEEII